MTNWIAFHFYPVSVSQKDIIWLETQVIPCSVARDLPTCVILVAMSLFPFCHSPSMVEFKILPKGLIGIRYYTYLPTYLLIFNNR